MNTIALEWTYKRTFTVKKTLSERLNNYKNKSKIINQALNLYFQKEDYIKNAEKDFFDSIEIEYFWEEEVNQLVNSSENKKLDETILKMKF
jgi:hypothetical protein